MKKLSLTFFLALICSFGFAQNKETDSLKQVLSFAKADTSRVLMMSHLSFAFDATNQDSSLYYAHKALDLAREINYPKGEFEALRRLVNYHRTKGDTPKALFYGQKAMQIAEDIHDHTIKGTILDQLAMI